MNDDPRDDINEKEIHIIFIATIVISLLMLSFLFLTGCTSLQQKKDKKLMIDCSNCKVKYERLDGHDFIELDQNIK